MKSISYQQIIKWLGDRSITIPTLGRRSTLTFWVEDGILNEMDAHGNRNTYSEEYWDEICAVIDATDPSNREMTRIYQHCRQYYIAPGVPALCRAYCEEHKL